MEYHHLWPLGHEAIEFRLFKSRSLIQERRNQAGFEIGLKPTLKLGICPSRFTLSTCGRRESRKILRLSSAIESGCSSC